MGISPWPGASAEKPLAPAGATRYKQRRTSKQPRPKPMYCPSTVISNPHPALVGTKAIAVATNVNGVLHIVARGGKAWAPVFYHSVANQAPQVITQGQAAALAFNATNCPTNAVHYVCGGLC